MMVPGAAVPHGDRAYGAKRGRRRHQGVDLFAPLGTPVYAPVDGSVRLATGSWRDGFSGYGRVVVLQLGDRELLVGHLDQVLVRPGDTVKRGQQLGTVGTTKFTREDKAAHFATSKPHVHVELLRGTFPVHPDTARLDPTELAFASLEKKKRVFRVTLEEIE